MQTSLKYRKTIFKPGQMLLNWMSSSSMSSSSSQLLYNVSDQDISQLIQQYCTNLLVAGVIKQIADKYAPIQETFRVSWKTICLRVCTCIWMDFFFVCTERSGIIENGAMGRLSAVGIKFFQ